MAAFSLLVVAAVFATLALAVGIVIAVVVAVRVLWLLRKARKESEAAFLRAEYTVQREGEADTSRRVIEGTARRE